MPSVLLVTQDLQRAGAQRQCVELALGLARLAEWTVAVAVLEPGGSLERPLRSAGIRLYDCPRRWRWDLSPAVRLARLARDTRADIVHTFLFLPNFYGRLARLVGRRPILISSLRSTGIEGWPRYLAEIAMAPLCDAIIANSEAGKRHMVARGVSAARIRVVRNGLDLQPFLSGSNGARAAEPSQAIGMVAQMEPRKDHVGLVTAFARLVARHSGIRLVLAGDGRLRPRVERAVREAGLEGSVDLPGTVEDPAPIYDRLSVYVQASAREEGTSNSIIEAMASGCPVVATDVGGNREVVRDGETGLVVPAGQPGALAEAIERLLASPETARRMGSEGRSRALALYSRAAMISATLEVYAALLSARAPSGG